MIAAALTILLAQTCAGIMPKPDIEVEWLRNGKSYARDVPIEATTSTRTYRRTPASGVKSVRTLSCSNGTGGVVLTESIDNQRRVRLPLGLKTGQVRTLDGVTVRRVKPPASAATNAFWFIVTSDAPRIYGVREGLGIVEMRMQSGAGNVDVYRAYARSPAPLPVPITQNPPELDAELSRLQYENRALQDSIARLESELRRARGEPDGEVDDAMPPVASPVDDRLLSFTGVDTYIQQGNYPAAIALLVRSRKQLDEYKRLSGSDHPAAPRVTARLNDVVRACVRLHPDNPSICAIR